jgi:amino acid transporter
MPANSGLIRSVGRWSLVALVVNTVIGSGVFALPGTVAGRLGWWSLLAVVGGAVLAGAIMVSFGEVASRFTAAGGPYLYAQAAFGRFMGLQMGWMVLFVRVVSAAVQVNLLTTYLAAFWAPAGTAWGSAAIGAVLLGFLAAVNVRGVAAGAGMSTAIAVVKLTSLFAFAALGMVWIAGGHPAPVHPPTTATVGGWLQVLLLLMFSFGGFEAALLPMGESKDPQRDAPFALLTGLGVVTLLYLLIQVTVLATLPDPGATDRPLAASAQALLGAPGAVLMTVVAAFSVYGWGAAAMLAVPRLMMAMAERGDLPAPLGRIHPAWRTPHIAILVFAGLVFVLTLQGGLLQNITLSTVSRLMTYGLVCASLLALRRADRTGAPRAAPAVFRAPFGTVAAGVGLALSTLLITRMTGREAIWLLVIVLLASLHWLVIRGRGRSVAD